MDVYSNKTKYENEIQKVARKCSRLWLTKEIAWARPAVVVTLSDNQVYQRLRRAFKLNTPVSFERAVGKQHDIEIEGVETILFPMIHPDISRPIDDNDKRKLNVRRKWAPLHKEHVANLYRLLVQVRNNR